jgi:hypothetical protein
MIFTDRMHPSNPNKAEKELDDNQNPHLFPFEYVRSKLGTSISKMLLEFEHEGEANQNYATALNTVLVWAGARNASLPSWIYCDEQRIREFMNHLNQISQQIPSNLRSIPDVTIVKRLQRYLSGKIGQLGLITRMDNPRIRILLDSPVFTASTTTKTDNPAI